MNESAANVLGYRRGRREDWISDDTMDLIQKKKNFKMKMETVSSQVREMLRNLHQAKTAEVKRSGRRDKKRLFNNIADEAKQAATGNDQRTLIEMAKELGGIKKRYNEVIRDANGNRTSSERDKVQRWKEHITKVLNCDEPTCTHVFENKSNELQIELGPIRDEEVKEAISKPKYNESPGEDPISAEMLKDLANFGIAILTSFYVKIWQTESAPRDWMDSRVVRVSEKGRI